MELVVLVGLPNSGKTNFARYLQSIRNNMVRVAIKDIYQMLDYRYDASKVDFYKELYYNMIRDALLKRQSVIADDMNITAADREKLIDLGCEIDQRLIITAYQMAVTPHQCLSFGDNVSASVMMELVKAYEYPSVDEGFSNIKGVKWGLADHPIILGNTTIEQKPEVFDIASAKVKVVSFKKGQSTV